MELYCGDFHMATVLWSSTNDCKTDVGMCTLPQKNPMFIRGLNYIFDSVHIIWCLCHSLSSTIYFTTQKDCRVSIYESDKRNVIKHPQESDDSQKCNTFLKTEETGAEGGGETGIPPPF